MRILDMTAGERNIWFNKKHPLACFIDIRPEVEPTHVLDARKMPLAEGHFNLVVFDPPHANLGTGRLAKLYGSHTAAGIRDLVTKGAIEAHRLSAPGALMAFKWNDHDQKLEKILALMPNWEPLFGHKVSAAQKRPSTTYWVMLRRLP